MTELISKLENLAMIEIENKEKMAKDLEEILKFVELINEVDTPQITTTTITQTTPLREDIPKRDNIIKEILKNAPKSKDNYFIVPKIIE